MQLAQVKSGPCKLALVCRRHSRALELEPIFKHLHGLQNGESPHSEYLSVGYFMLRTVSPHLDWRFLWGPGLLQQSRLPRCLFLEVTPAYPMGLHSSKAVQIFLPLPSGKICRFCWLNLGIRHKLATPSCLLLWPGLSLQLPCSRSLRPLTHSAYACATALC